MIADFQSFTGKSVLEIENGRKSLSPLIKCQINCMSSNAFLQFKLQVYSSLTKNLEIRTFTALPLGN